MNKKNETETEIKKDSLMSTEVIDIKAVLNGKEENFFRSSGYSKIKITKIVDGEPKVFYKLLQIFPVSNDEYLKKFKKAFPVPEPRVKTRILDRKLNPAHGDINMDLVDEGTDPEYRVCTVYDYTDPQYKKEVEEYNDKYLYVTVILGLGLEKDYQPTEEDIDRFVKDFQRSGITGNQMQKIGNDIRNLDFLESRKRK